MASVMGQQSENSIMAMLLRALHAAAVGAQLQLFWQFEGGPLTVILLDATQPLASVTATVCVPAQTFVNVYIWLVVVTAVPPSRDTEYCPLPLGVPPDTVAVIDPLQFGAGDELLVDVRVACNVAPGPLTVELHVAAQLLASVTVTTCAPPQTFVNVCVFDDV